MPEPILLRDPRIDALSNSAILTDTQVRLTFAPRNPDSRVLAKLLNVSADKITQMQALMQLGTIHLQIKAGFGAERSIELNGPEGLILMELFDRFITELPRVDDGSTVE